MCNDFLVPGFDAHGVTHVDTWSKLQFLLHNHSWVRRPVHFPAMLVSGRIYSQLPSPSTRKVLQPSTKLYELQLDGRPLCLVRKAHRSFLSFTPNQVGSISIRKNDDVRVLVVCGGFPGVVSPIFGCSERRKFGFMIHGSNMLKCCPNKRPCPCDTERSRTY